MKLRKRPVAVFADLGRARVGEASRPLASGVHVSKRFALGALGFTSAHRNDEREVESRSSHPRGTGVLDEQ